MKTTTNQTIVLSMKQMETIIARMNENIRREPAMSEKVKFQLSFDTDYNAHIIEPETKGYQFSGYQECNGMDIKI
ncbi:hypothetical protein FACS189432_05150 [Bacteroidia bacterium]|nr:hypothetical protein FACS189426_06620 [Bacteroidia bacterium]GHT27912.1 hypothetical protein FACS189432_05150 [Bacteroidia bacterium]